MTLAAEGGAHKVWRTLSGIESLADAEAVVAEAKRRAEQIIAEEANTVERTCECGIEFESRNGTTECPACRELGAGGRVVADAALDAAGVVDAAERDGIMAGAGAGSDTSPNGGPPTDSAPASSGFETFRRDPPRAMGPPLRSQGANDNQVKSHAQRTLPPERPYHRAGEAAADPPAAPERTMKRPMATVAEVQARKDRVRELLREHGPLTGKALAIMAELADHQLSVILKSLVATGDIVDTHRTSREWPGSKGSGKQSKVWELNVIDDQIRDDLPTNVSTDLPTDPPIAAEEPAVTYLGADGVVPAVGPVGEGEEFPDADTEPLALPTADESPEYPETVHGVLVIFAPVAGGGWAARVPDLPECVASADSRVVCRGLIAEAIVAHREEMEAVVDEPAEELTGSEVTVMDPYPGGMAPTIADPGLTDPYFAYMALLFELARERPDDHDKFERIERQLIGGPPQR